MVTKQSTVAGDAVVVLEDPESRPDAHCIVGQNRFADIALESLDHARRRPVATRHYDGVRIRPICPTAQFAGRFRLDDGVSKPTRLVLLTSGIVLAEFNESDFEA